MNKDMLKDNNILRKLIYSAKLMNCFYIAVNNNLFKQKYLNNNGRALLSFRDTYYNVVHPSITKIGCGERDRASLPGDLDCVFTIDGKFEITKGRDKKFGIYYFDNQIDVLDFACMHYILRDCRVVD